MAPLVLAFLYSLSTCALPRFFLLCLIPSLFHSVRPSPPRPCKIDYTFTFAFFCLDSFFLSFLNTKKCRIESHCIVFASVLSQQILSLPVLLLKTVSTSPDQSYRHEAYPIRQRQREVTRKRMKCNLHQHPICWVYYHEKKKMKIIISKMTLQFALWTIRRLHQSIRVVHYSFRINKIKNLKLLLWSCHCRVNSLHVNDLVQWEEEENDWRTDG